MGTIYSIETVVKGLKDSLHQYLEAQYHIRNESLIRERHTLLEESGCTYQTPFLESTPVYVTGTPYDTLHIPDAAKKLLQTLSTLPGVGIPPQPYLHQTEALEAFLGRDENIIVATGTGSGKTETFLMPILGRLAIESLAHPETVSLPGCRALLLYPMNALVNDQVARLRKLLGNQQVANILLKGRKRYVRFGMYTGRTPYPGQKNDKKNKERLKPLFDKLYRSATDEIRERLIAEGKWPSKDMLTFEVQNYTTLAADRELFTRHEMQKTCPDILVTNYAMLEYILLRPIEREILTQTQQWLESHPDNHFTVVLDEAHIYRGGAGAEVALLLRRLQSRLEIPKNRIRYILTSASLGSTKEAAQQVIQFALDLTGQAGSGRKLTLITGTTLQRENARTTSDLEAKSLATFDLAAFQQIHENFSTARDAVHNVIRSIGIGSCGEVQTIDALQEKLFSALKDFGPASKLIALTSGKSMPFNHIAEQLCPDTQMAIANPAIESLLALMTFARRQQDGRTFAPLRVHLFFRGLAGLFACINTACTEKRDQTHPSLLGKLHDRARMKCGCGSRVYELLTHRDCGAAFIRGYMRNKQGDFLWHEASEPLTEKQTKLLEVHLLVENAVPPKMRANVIKIWLQIASGRINHSEPSNQSGYLPVYRTTLEPQIINGEAILTFQRCPVCMRQWKAETTKISDLATKGEAPFAHLIKTQVDLQPATRKKEDHYPNAGRKSLLFSDGRQKAARLARDIPIEVERDTFRQVIVLAIKNIEAFKPEVKPTWDLFLAFLSILHQHNLLLFYGDDRDRLVKTLTRFCDDFDCDLKNAIDYWEPEKIPYQYMENLLRQLGHSYYSLTALTIGYLEPIEHWFSQIKKAINFVDETELKSLSIAWISHLLDDFAFNEEILGFIRERAAGYQRQGWGSKGKWGSDLRKLVEKVYGQDKCSQIEEVFKKKLANESHGLYFLKPERLKLRLRLTEAWYQCTQCTFLYPVTFRGHCVLCGHNNTIPLEPDNSDYLRARKSFWRDPVINTIESKQIPFNLDVEEHTAQLSYRDTEDISTTLEEFELRFRDILINEKEKPVDVLSSTTTMEVGVDIGALVAVGLRNVPPQRQNYQQRAGRAGRRGSTISTVITYAQNGAYDSYYFDHPEKIITGEPPLPSVDVRNERIIVRHIHAALLQAFFHEKAQNRASSSDLFTVLGTTHDFYDLQKPFSFPIFKDWLTGATANKVLQSVNDWLPDDFELDIEGAVNTFLHKLESIKPANEEKLNLQSNQLIEFLHSHGLLPSYALPIDLCAFQIEEKQRGQFKVKIVEKPQQSMNIALTEYAPGRFVIVNKKTYQIGSIAADLPSTVLDRAKPLFDNSKQYIYCSACSYVQAPSSALWVGQSCPLCGTTQLNSMEMIRPEVVFPSGKREINELDNEPIFTSATAAQLPAPTGNDVFKSHWSQFGTAKFVHAGNQLLVMVNKGKDFSNERKGFEICELCGYATISENKASGPHFRNYEISVPRNNAYPPTRCKGHFRRVYLGYDFRSDILLLRIPLIKPLVSDLIEPLHKRPLEEALSTLAEAIVQAAGHYLDIDKRELSAGHRFVYDAEILSADIFVYDTLSGGAGYADMAGKHFHDIFALAKQRLNDCTCDNSCQACLRHYGNRLRHTHLDRFLALDLVQYIEKGIAPKVQSREDQLNELRGLRAMLEMEGWQCQEDGDVPLLVQFHDKIFQLGTYPSLLDINSQGHPLSALPNALLFSRYQLVKDLPSTFQQVQRP